MSSFLEVIVRKFLHTFRSFRYVQSLQEVVLDIARNEVSSIRYKDQKFLYVTPSKLTRFRASSLLSKEPETLQWIEGFAEGSVLWDVGANVGLYSIFAARIRGCKVVAFEPSIFNLECLGRNLVLNEVADRVIVCPLPLHLKTGVDALKYTSTELGGALSTYGESFGFDGRPIDSEFSIKTLGIKLDEVGAVFPIPLPDYIKLDVDGIEHLILKGGNSLLSRPKGILVEVNDAFSLQAEQVSNLLTAAGFRLIGKLRGGAEAAGDGIHGMTFNQIWERGNGSGVER